MHKIISLRRQEPYMAVSDTHGYLDNFKQLEWEIRNALGLSPDASLPIIHLGDMTDRGPKGVAVAKEIFTRVAAGTGIALFGNHESMLIKIFNYDEEPSYASTSARLNWLDNGGIHVLMELKELGELGELPIPAIHDIDQALIIYNPRLECLVDCYRTKTKLFHIQDRTLFVHAGFLVTPEGVFKYIDARGNQLEGLAAFKKAQSDLAAGTIDQHALKQIIWPDPPTGLVHVFNLKPADRDRLFTSLGIDLIVMGHHGGENVDGIIKSMNPDQQSKKIINIDINATGRGACFWYNGHVIALELANITSLPDHDPGVVTHKRFRLYQGNSDQKLVSWASLLAFYVSLNSSISQDSLIEVLTCSIKKLIDKSDIVVCTDSDLQRIFGPIYRVLEPDAIVPPTINKISEIGCDSAFLPLNPLPA
jgi:hypothetical protein